MPTEYERMKLIEKLEVKLARYMNPWTVEMLHLKNGWMHFLHEVPVTLQEAEKTADEFRATFPKAKFRVVPWLNTEQRAHIRSEWEPKP